jgi:small subunit ribosomal protein S7
MASKAAPVLRTLPFRPVIGVKRPLVAYRPYSSAQNSPDKLPQAPEGRLGAHQTKQEHVSEEAAKIAKAQGQEGPDLEQGTPVQEILKEEKDTRQHAPEVLKQDVKAGSSGAKPDTDPSGKRSFSTMARRRMEVEPHATAPMDPAILNSFRTSSREVSTQDSGLKFPTPVTPLPQMKNRHDPIVTQLTNLMMRDGKKAKAENDMATILSILRTNPAPTYNPNRQLLPGAPPASHLPLNPVLYLTLAIDSVAPLLRIRSQRGAAGGGQALQIPVPLGLRQRRRQAFTWILDAASKKGDRLRFPERVAQEIVSVVEGKSGVWERRAAVHKLGTAARTSLGWGGKGGFRR